MRKIKPAEDEIYHVFNRGVDGRAIFKQQADLERFFDGLNNLNTIESVGHLARCRNPVSTRKLVELIAYDLNPNHFHLILKQIAERGIERYMHRLSVSHSKYFNLKYSRVGTLFQGRFKAILVDTNDYLLHLSVYVNLNDRAHARGGKLKLSKSSWEEYVGEVREEFCAKSIILDQFKNKKEYRKFAEKTLKHIIDRKISLEELKNGESNDMSKPGFDTKT